MPAFLDDWKSHADSLPEVSERELELYSRYHALLAKWNENIGLVSRKSIERAFAIHFADSTFIARAIRPHVPNALADVGTGAGFPGLVFAIRYPEAAVTLYEKQLKKQSFLSAVIAELSIPNARVEGLFPDKKQSGFFLSRAFLPREELFPFFKKKTTPGSLLAVCLGGTEKPEEKPPAHFELVADTRYSLPLGEGDRRVKIFRRST